MADRRLPLWIALLITAVALGAATLTFVLLDEGDDEAAVDVDGDPQPRGELADIDLTGLTYQTLDGETRSLDDLRGSPTVVNFLASWCTPCRTEAPGFQAVFEDLGGEVQFLGLAIRDRPEDTRRFIEDLGITFPVGRDVDSAIGLETGAIVRMPGTVLLDAEGRVVARHIGALDEGELRRLLRDEVGAGA